jgi:nucleotide-binding universal stress UspA family protein
MKESAMKKSIPVLTRLLLPVKDSLQLRSVLPLVELVSRSMSDELEKVDLLHVVGGSFLSTHLGNIDFRAGRVLSSERMQRLRDQHYQETVNPLLFQVQELLEKSGVALQAQVTVQDGDPVKKITGVCERDGYSTLIMSRRKVEADRLFIGTVLNGVINRHFSASFYVVGEEGFPVGTSPAARVMIGIDGSATCLRAVKEAAVLLGRVPEVVEQVSLVHVLDPTCLYDEGGTDCQQMAETGNKYMREAEDLMVKGGVEKTKIVATLLFGKPGETLTEHAGSFGATMCYIGRRDRSKIAEVLLGSVCGDFVQRCRKKTVVLVS